MEHCTASQNRLKLRIFMTLLIIFCCLFSKTAAQCSPSTKIACGPNVTDFTRAKCLDHKGCCWDGRSKLKCYYKENATFEPKCFIEPKFRIDCGDPSTRPQECFDRGCCWNSTIMNVKWCFYSSPSTTIVTTSKAVTETTTATLTEINTTPTTVTETTTTQTETTNAPTTITETTTAPTTITETTTTPTTVTETTPTAVNEFFTTPTKVTETTTTTPTIEDETTTTTPTIEDETTTTTPMIEDETTTTTPTIEDKTTTTTPTIEEETTTNTPYRAEKLETTSIAATSRPTTTSDITNEPEITTTVSKVSELPILLSTNQPWKCTVQGDPTVTMFNGDKRILLKEGNVTLYHNKASEIRIDAVLAKATSDSILNIEKVMMMSGNSTSQMTFSKSGITIDGDPTPFKVLSPSNPVEGTVANFLNVKMSDEKFIRTVTLTVPKRLEYVNDEGACGEVPLN